MQPIQISVIQPYEIVINEVSLRNSQISKCSFEPVDDLLTLSPNFLCRPGANGAIDHSFRCEGVI